MRITHSAHKPKKKVDRFLVHFGVALCTLALVILPLSYLLGLPAFLVFGKVSSKQNLGVMDYATKRRNSPGWR